VNEAAHPLAITVPYGTDVAALTPTITHTGASVSPSGGHAQHFTKPLACTLPAADTTTQAYTVTVTVAANPAKAITAFGFTTPAAIGRATWGDDAIAPAVADGAHGTALTTTVTAEGARVCPTSRDGPDCTDRGPAP